VATTRIDPFLHSRDLDELLALRQEFAETPPDPESEAEIRAVLDDWADEQAISNLLMHPQLIPEDQRNADVQRGLDDVENPYVRLAAVIGIGELDLSQITDIERQRFVTTLLDLIASDGTVCADRASFSLVWVMRQPDAPEVLDCLAHPSPRVRHNILQGLLEMLGTSGLGALIDVPGFAAPEAQDAARRAVVEAGLDLSGSVDDQRKPLVMAYVPNLIDFQPAE
jgi:hypothetical protein